MQRDGISGGVNLTDESARCASKDVMENLGIETLARTLGIVEGFFFP